MHDRLRRDPRKLARGPTVPPVKDAPLTVENDWILQTVLRDVSGETVKFFDPEHRESVSVRMNFHVLPPVRSGESNPGEDHQRESGPFLTNRQHAPTCLLAV